ncbi:PAS domain-containing protein [Streptomyces antimycoticus]|uniref:PAS domain-containing protein n=1 Tax=Streptomyces antimycoticus TaxID=68175 RepID=UPI0034238AFF
MAHGDPGQPVDEASAAMLEAMFTSSPVGLHLLNTDLRVVRLNTAAPAIEGVPSDGLIGRPIRDVYHMVECNDTETALRHVLETGEPLWQRLVHARVKGDPPEERCFEATARRLQGRNQEVLGLAVTAVDVTEGERVRARARVLEDVRRGVGRILDPAVTGEELVAAVVPNFADVAIVEVVDSVIRGDEPPPAPLPPGTPLVRTAFRSGHAEPPQAHPVGDVRRLPGPTPFTQALADLRPRMVPLHPSAPWMPADPARTEAMHASQSHTLLVVPLALRDAALGLVSLYRTGESRPSTRATGSWRWSWPPTRPCASTTRGASSASTPSPPLSSGSCSPAAPRRTHHWRPPISRSPVPIPAPGTTPSRCPAPVPRWWSGTCSAGA